MLFFLASKTIHDEYIFISCGGNFINIDARPVQFSLELVELKEIQETCSSAMLKLIIIFAFRNDCDSSSSLSLFILNQECMAAYFSLFLRFSFEEYVVNAIKLPSLEISKHIFYANVAIKF